MRKSSLIFLFTLTVIITVWYVFVKLKIFSPLLLPSPLAVILSIVELLNDKILIDILATLYRMFIGLFIGVISGLFIGMMMGIFDCIAKSLKFWIDFLRSLPVTALIPLFLLFFGIGETTKIALVAYLTTLIIVIHTIAGIHQANGIRKLAARSIEPNRVLIFLKVILPDALPLISTGIKLALSFSLIIVIVSEMMISASFGLGGKIIDYQLVYRTADMYAVIILTGLLGYLINALYLALEKRLIHWTGK